MAASAAPSAYLCRRICRRALQMAYVIAILPAWLLAAVDWWQSRLLATTIAGAALSCAAALCIGFPFIDPFAVMMAGLVAALPAAVSFWLSNMNEVRMSARRFGQDSNELVDRPTEPRMRCELPIYESPPGSINLNGKPCLSPQSSANTECAKQCSEVFGNLH